MEGDFSVKRSGSCEFLFINLFTYIFRVSGEGVFTFSIFKSLSSSFLFLFNVELRSVLGEQVS